MLPGAPSQLLPAVLLPTVLVLARPGELLGVWLRGCHHPLRLYAQGRCVLVGADLGRLLRRCARVAVRDGVRVAVLDAEQLIAWRTLQIVSGAPFLPHLDRLRALYPQLRVQGTHIALPIGLKPPEEVLAACAAMRVRVASSRIEYRG